MDTDQPIGEPIPVIDHDLLACDPCRIDPGTLIGDGAALVLRDGALPLEPIHIEPLRAGPPGFHEAVRDKVNEIVDVINRLQIVIQEPS
jgi:hypothetical protein